MAAGVSQLQDASWQDRVLIGIQQQESGTVKYFAGLTQEVDLPDLSRDVEGTPVMNGGRVRENSAEDDFEVTLTIYPIGVLTDDSAADSASRPEGVGEWFLSSEDLSDTSEGSRFEPTLDRYDFDIALTWTNVEGVDADSEISTTDNVKAALRWVFKNGQITEFNQDFGDRVHTAEVTFKFTPYNELGEANYFYESTSDTTTDTLPQVLA